MKKAIATLSLLIFFISCSAPMRVKQRTQNVTDRSVQSSIDCNQLLSERDGWQLVGKILAGAGGIGAIGAAPEDLSQKARWGIAVGAAGTAVLGTAFVWYGELKSEEFEEYCEVENGK